VQGPGGAVGGDAELTIVGPVRTLDPEAPRAAGVVVRHGRVAALLSRPDDHPAGPVLRLPPGAVAVPGFVDPHLHLLGMAARRLGLETDGASSTELLARIGREAGGTGWLRVYGFDEALAPDRRRPTRAELDAVSPVTPVVVRHRAGYEALLNSAALAAVGAAGLEGEWLPAGDPALAGIPDHGRDDLVAALRLVFAELGAAGITTVVDASVENDLTAVGLVAAAGGARPRVAMMPGIGALPSFVAAGFRYGDRVEGIPLRHVKILPPGAGGVDVRAAVERARAAGWPVAIHAIDVDEVAEAVDAIGTRPGRVRDRIEHCGLSLPDQIEDIARTGAAVVTQPAFLTSRAAKYREELSAVEREWIYRIGSLRRAGVLVAASSDAPVAPADPLAAVEAARTRGGDEATAGERVDAATALVMVTRDAAAAADLPGGVLTVGGPGDVVVLSADPAVSTDRPAVLATVVGGRVLAGHGAASGA